MQIQKPKKSRKIGKIIFWIVLVVLLLVAVVEGYMLVSGKNLSDLNPFAKKSTSTSSEKTEKNNTKTSSTNSSAEKNNSTSSTDKNAISQTTDPNQTGKNASVGTVATPSALNISANMSVQGSSVRVVANITNIVSSDGTCQITAGNYSASVAIVANAQNSSCEINSIPLAQIGTSRTFTITATSDGKTGSVSGNIQ